MRYRREQQFQQLSRKQDEEDCSWNSIIVWGICVSVIVLIILYISFGPNLYHPPPVLVGSETVSTLDSEKKSIPVFESTANIDGVGSVFYRYTEPRGQGRHVQPDVLLLHGAKYGSQTWKGVGTLQILSYWGYRTIAIDLPGYKLSKKATPPQTTSDYISFMEQIVDKLKLTKVVIVAPSMSGKYGLPVLVEQNNIDLVGFIGIAPESTNKYSRLQYQSVDTPTLVMWGERDKTPLKEESLYFMENIPEHTTVMIPKAEHAAFVGNPEQFHKEILRFLSSQCVLGEDTDTEYDLGTDSDYFGYGDDTYDSDTDYYGDSDTDSYPMGEEYLQAYFAGDDIYGAEYYDESDLLLDVIKSDGYDGYDTDTDFDTEEDADYR